MRKSAALLIAVVGTLLSASPALRADTVAENTNFIDKAYQDLLQRSPSTIEVASGLAALGSETREQFALTLDISTEYYRLLVNSYFQDLLSRPPSITELNSFTGLLVSSSTDESVQALLASTPEFFSDNGGTNAGFVAALFNNFLKRSPSAAELSFWENQLSTLTLSRDQVAAMILGSSEYDTDLVQSYYLQFLQRPADPTGLAFFETALHGGTLTDEQVIASLIGTDEYFTLAQPIGTTPTPEPRSVVLLGLGLAAIVLLRKLC
jgi:hypothetical protein